MVVTTTAISFILLSLGLAVCGWRFWVAHKKTGDSQMGGRAGLLLSLAFFATAIHNGILGIGALIAAPDPINLYIVSVTAYLFLISFALLSVYTAFYIFLPLKSPFIAMSLTGGIGGIGLITALSSNSRPFVTPGNGIDWNMDFAFALSVLSLFLISLSVFFYIFTRLFKISEVREIRLLSLVVAATAFIGAVNIFIRLVLFRNAPSAVRTSLLDSGIGTIGAVFVVALIVFPVIKNWLKVLKK